MAYIVPIGSDQTQKQSALGPFTTPAAANSFRDKLQVRIGALPENPNGVWVKVTTLELPALARTAGQWGLRPPDDTVTL